MRSRRIAVVSFELTADDLVAIRDPLRDAVFSSGEESEKPKIPVERDPWGNLILRASSIAGSLRAELGRYAVAVAHPDLTFVGQRARGVSAKTWARPASIADLICGSEAEETQLPSKKRASTERVIAPSALRIVAVDVLSGAPVVAPPRVAIDRFTGAAVTHKIFVDECVSGLTASVLAEVDLAVVASRAKALGVQADDVEVLDAFMFALGSWVPMVGSGRSHGLGRMSLGNLDVRLVESLPLERLFASSTTIEFLRDAKLGERRRVPGSADLVRSLEPGDDWSWQVSMTATDPLLIAPTHHDGERANVLVTSSVLKGTSWRGVFRSRCEFILRSCGRDDVCLSTEKSCGHCPTCTLFGWSAPGGESTGSIGLVTFDDSKVTGSTMTIDHNAIDRFTGGAADEKLFASKAYVPGSQLTLSVRVTRPTHPVPGWAKALLVLVVLDLADGLIGLGHSTTRGFGTLSPDVRPSWPDSRWWDQLPPPWVAEKTPMAIKEMS